MPRMKRQWVSQHEGSFHIISRTVGGDIWFDESEREFLMKLLMRLAAGFFIEIHAFCIMGNHFHILATNLDVEAQNAEVGELYHRYRLIHGKKADPPVGSFREDGSFIPDEDGGVERLRQRLGSISRFVQELKQTFSCWYNKKHDRKGYLWSDRFKGVIVDKGEAQLACSTYIDLNPVRAGIVDRPEEYRWSGLGLRVRNPARAQRLLRAIFEAHGEPGSNLTPRKNDFEQLSWYREFVYVSGGIEREGKGNISQELMDDVLRCHGKLGIGDSFHYRVKNISEGLAFGTFSFIADVQRRLNRKFVRPRSFFQGEFLFATRVLRC